MNRSRTTWIVLGAVLLVLVGAVAADRIGLAKARSTAEAETAEAAGEQHFTYTGKPEVTVQGAVFLPQLLSGTVDKVTTRLHDVNLSGLTLTLFTTVATKVHGGVADELVGTGTAGFDVVQGLFAVPDLTVSGVDGRLRLKVLAQLAPGAPKMPLTVTGDLTVVDGKAKFTATDVAEAAQLPPAAVPAIKAQFSREVTLPPLPYGLILRSAKVTHAGVEITATQRNVVVVD